MSWKFFLFSLIVLSSSALGNTKTTRGASNPSNQPAFAAQQLDSESSDPSGIRKRQRVATKRYVKNSDQLKTDPAIEKSYSQYQKRNTDSNQFDAQSEFGFRKLPNSYQDKVRQRIRVQNYAKKYTAPQQLVILTPPGNSTLVANTTSSVYVSTTSLAKSYTTDVDTVVSFSCPTGIFNITVPLGVNTTFFVDPNINGNCEILASVPNDPNYINSLPSFVSIFTPIYFAGLPDNNFYTGERVELFARPSNDAVFSIDVTIACRFFSKTISIVTDNKPVPFVFPALLVGRCEVSSGDVPPYYLSFSPFEIQIDSAIFFLRPAANTTFKAGEDIVANLFATNLNTTVDVTVDLYCNSQFVKSLTQNIKTSFVFTASDNIYGNCVLSMGEIDGYFTEQTVPIVVLQALKFVDPKENQLIVPGTNYDIQVNGNAPVGTVTVLVTGKCSNGGVFTESVQIGVKKTVLMGSNLLGFCTLTATAPGFSEAILPILVYSPLTPEEMAKEASRLQLVGKIFKKTENTD